jgi:hypothetical protein
VIVGLMISFASASAAMADADAAAYTACLFATSRSASVERLSASAFEQRLAGACRTEQRTLERALAGVLALQGQGHPVAQAKELTEDARRMIIDDYRRMLQLEPELRRLGEICKANPDRCRD